MAADGSRASTGSGRTVLRRASRPSQREQAAAEARTRILAAAADCIVRDGLAQVRMASIARTAGVSAGLLHYHFDTKELLFGEVLRYSHEISGRAQPARARGRRRGPRGAALVLPRPVPAQRRAACGRVAPLAGAGAAVHPRPAPRQGRGRSLRGPLRHHGRHRPRGGRRRGLRHRPRPAGGRRDSGRAHRRTRWSRPGPGPQPRDRRGARHDRHHGRDPGRPRRTTSGAGGARRCTRREPPTSWSWARAWPACPPRATSRPAERRSRCSRPVPGSAAASSRSSSPTAAASSSGARSWATPTPATSGWSRSSG